MSYQLDGILTQVHVLHAQHDDKSLSALFCTEQKVLIDPFRYGLRTIWVLLDKNVEDHPETKRLISELTQSLGEYKKNILVTAIEGGEDSKSTPVFLDTADKALEYFGHTPEVLVAIGGGSILNLATFIAATLHNDGIFFFEHKDYAVRKTLERTKNLVLVPTTILAVADVAYGSKGNINMLNGNNHILTECMLLNGMLSEDEYFHLHGQTTQKHGWKVYRDPTEIYVSPDYIRTLPVDEIKRGLSEVLKHALLQDATQSGLRGRLSAAVSSLRAYFNESAMDAQKVPLLNDVLEQMKSPQPNPETCFQLAMQTMYAKSLILQQDRWEENWIASLLSYGHLHAHALEMATDFKICHGDSVLIGMLVDLKLAGDRGLYTKVLETVPFTPIAKETHLLQVDAEKLEYAYLHEPKEFFKDKQSGGYKVLPLQRNGQYSGQLGKDSPQQVFSLEQIIRTYYEVIGDIQSCLNLKSAPDAREQISLNVK